MKINNLGHSRRVRTISGAVVTVLATTCVVAAGAQAAETARLRTHLVPDKLGASTTIEIKLNINSSNDSAVSPLTGFALGLPRGMGLLETTLGLAECSRSTLLARGLAGCPQNSRLGTGHIAVELPFASGPIGAQAQLTPVRAPSSGSTLITALLYFNVLRPVFGRLVFSANLGESSAANEQLATGPLAPIPLGPEGPDVVVRYLSATFGPLHLTYYKREAGKRVAFKPTGLTLPSSCPRKGFLFAAQLTFLDGTQTTAKSRVPCPA